MIMVPEMDQIDNNNSHSGTEIYVTIFKLAISAIKSNIWNKLRHEKNKCK